MANEYQEYVLINATTDERISGEFDCCFITGEQALKEEILEGKYHPCRVFKLGPELKVTVNTTVTVEEENER